RWLYYVFAFSLGLMGIGLVGWIFMEVASWSAAPRRAPAGGGAGGPRRGGPAPAGRPGTPTAWQPPPTFSRPPAPGYARFVEDDPDPTAAIPMNLPLTVPLGGRSFTWDGERWSGTDDNTTPPQSIAARLDAVLVRLLAEEDDRITDRRELMRRAREAR